MLKILTRIVFPLLILVVGGYALYLKMQAQPLPVLGQIQGFELTDTQNSAFNADRMKGQVWVANFIFTRCSGVCPMMTKNLQQVQKAFREQDDLGFVSFSVDPEFDTPERLKKYKQKYNIKTAAWYFLTGEREKIKQVMFDQFKLGFAKDVMFHSDRMVLVDGRQQIRGYYQGTDTKVYQRLKKDIAQLIKEPVRL